MRLEREPFLLSVTGSGVAACGETDGRVVNSEGCTVRVATGVAGTLVLSSLTTATCSLKNYFRCQVNRSHKSMVNIFVYSKGTNYENRYSKSKQSQCNN